MRSLLELFEIFYLVSVIFILFSFFRLFFSDVIVVDEKIKLNFFFSDVGN